MNIPSRNMVGLFLATFVALMSAVGYGILRPNPYNATVDVANFAIGDLPALGLDKEDSERLFRAVIRRRLAQEPAAATVEELLAEQQQTEMEAQAREAAQAALAAEMEATRAAAQRELDDIAVVAVSSAKYLPTDFERRRFDDQWILRLAIRNTDPKSRVLKGAQGTLQVQHMMGDPILDLNLTVGISEKPISVGDTFSWEATLDVNQFVEGHTTAINTPFSSLKFVWKPTKYLFADDTVLSVPE